MKTLKLLLSTILLLGSTFLSAQDATDVSSYAPRDYTIIPPSPEVASMVRNVDFPVTPFTGQIDISLPIYTITEGNLSVPISVQYLSGGLKVDDQPGNLGLSWVINAGGCISRTVHGHPDEANEGTSNIRGLFNITVASDSLRELAKSTIADYDPSDYEYFKNHRTGKKSWGLDYYYGRADMANDILKINCLGLSGTFIYNDDKDIVISSSQPMSILPQEIFGTHYPTQFIVTDNSGTKYYFGQVNQNDPNNSIERTKYEYYHGNPGNQLLDSMYYISAWHLTKIKNPQNDSIIFHYTTKKKRTRIGSLVETYYAASNSDLSHKLPDFVASCGSVIYNPVSLSAIECSNAIVRFTYDNDINTEKITQIRVYPNNDSNTPIKTYNFTYTTFLNSNGPEKTLLTKISENNIDQYKFAYYTEPNTNEIPFRNFDQDFCGYYNAAENNGIAPDYDHFSHHNPNDRYVNPNVCYYGTLKNIEYPTGGSTTFEWESHEYGYFNNKPVESLNKQITTTLKTDTLIALEESQKLEIPHYQVNNNNQFVTVDLSNYFNSFNPQILLNTDYYGLCHEYANCIGLPYPRVSFINNQTKQSCAEHTVFIDNCTVSGHNKGLVNVYLTPGVDYSVKLQYPTSIYAYDGFDTEELLKKEFKYADAPCGKIFLYKHVNTSGSDSSLITQKAKWGGLRISRIISKANDDSEPIVKGYYYAYADPNLSSGVVSTQPDYASNYYYVTKNDVVPGFEGSMFYQISSNGFYNLPVGNVGVEYSKVNEWCSHKIEPENGTYPITNTVQYTYSSNLTLDYRDFNNTEFRDYQPTGSQMWTSKAHHRGNLLSKQYTTYPGGSENINIKYDYNIFEPEPEDLSVLTTDLFRLSDFTTAPVSGIYTGAYDYCIGKYNLIPYNKTIKNEIYIENNYCDTTQYTYFYDSYTDNLDYNLLRSKIKTTSDRKTKETFYTYRCVNGIHLNIPETEVTVVDGIIVDAKRMVYDNNNLLIKSYGLSDKGINASEYNLGSKSASQQLVNLINQPEYSYEYNNHGDLVQISYNNEVLASYLWGYRGSYPIVEAKNLPYSELLSTINGLGKNPEQFYSATGNVESDLSSFFNSLRNALPNNDITTMTYHWLIGVSSATDSRGITTHFSFDNQGRLSTVKDYNGYFIRKYDYHYKQ
ncbi:MAG: hypothetical protein IKJ52_05230 [Muribaculaceae bacterium]|nr:hypothetical protein [Muribaculaceae bacterium]